MSIKPTVLTDKYEDYSTRLDWRWARVQALFGDDTNPVSGFDDVDTVRAWRFIKAYQETTNISDRQLLRMKYPHEVRAYDYFLNSDMRKLRLEALCLCPDLTQSVVAQMLGEDVKVINMFEKFFFDVRVRDRDVTFNALFPPTTFEKALGTNLCDKIWKFVAITAGSRMLAGLMDPSKLDENTDDYFLAMGRRNTIKAYGVGHLVQPMRTNDHLIAVSEKIFRILELDIKDRDSRGGSVPEAQQTILHKCMEATFIQVMDPDYKLESPYEPTVEQLLSQAEPMPVPVVA